MNQSNSHRITMYADNAFMLSIALIFLSAYSIQTLFEYEYIGENILVILYIVWFLMIVILMYSIDIVPSIYPDEVKKNQ